MENKYQEALDNVRKVYVESNHYDEEDIRLLQELIDEKTPMKPIVKELKRPDGKGGEEFWQYLYKCPKCEENYNKNGFGHFNSLDKGVPYCKHCGQKLDWSNKDEY